MPLCPLATHAGTASALGAFRSETGRQCSGSWAWTRLTSEFLRSQVKRLTALEADPALAESLRRRMHGANVEVVTGDAAAMPFRDRTFSGCGTFTMLHHVPSPQLQDTVLREIRRVLRPGGELVGSDSLPSAVMWLIHLGDDFVPVDPDKFPGRLEAAGFEMIQVEKAPGFFRFHARRPHEITDSHEQKGRDERD
jgi:SAM-dependent methyltransferase